MSFLGSCQLKTLNRTVQLNVAFNEVLADHCFVVRWMIFVIFISTTSDITLWLIFGNLNPTFCV